MAGETPGLPQDLVTGLFEHVQALDRFHLAYALIGGIAAGYRSRPRFTADLDFLLDVPQLVLPTLLDDLQRRGFAFDPPTAMREWTTQHLTVLSFHGVRIDWLKPVLALYRHVIDRAPSESWLGRSVRIASAEGVILTKLIAFRGQDLVDIENLLAANRGLLDLALIDREWQTVADADDPRRQRFKDMVAEFYLPPPNQGMP